MVLDLEKLKKENKSLKEKKVKESKNSKLLKKPHAEIPKLNATKFISNLASNSNEIAYEVPTKEVTQDNRSLFFNSEFSSEKKDMFKWLRS